MACLVTLFCHITYKDRDDPDKACSIHCSRSPAKRSPPKSWHDLCYIGDCYEGFLCSFVSFGTFLNLMKYYDLDRDILEAARCAGFATSEAF